jgi:Ca2+-binding EF-hand superfamily protein
LGNKETKGGIQRIFELFDDDRTNSINIHNLRRVAKELGETMSAEELKEMLERAASNGDEITFDDFYFIMTKKTFA